MLNKCYREYTITLPDGSAIMADPLSRIVRFKGVVSDRLSFTQYELLGILLNAFGRVATKNEIYTGLYGGCWKQRGRRPQPVNKNVDIQVSRLRKRLEPTGLAIWTHWAEGFELVVPGPTAYNTASNRSSATINTADTSAIRHNFRVVQCDPEA